MQIAVTGSAGSSAPRCSRRCAAEGHARDPGPPGATRPATGLRWDPDGGHDRRRGLRRARRGRAPRGRRDRGQALDRRAEAPDPREPYRPDAAARDDPGRARAPAGRARVRARRSGGTATAAPRCSTRRARRPEHPDFLPTCAAVGSRDRTGRGCRHPHGAPPHRDRPRRRGRRAARGSPRRSSSGSAAGSAPGAQYMSWIALDDEVGAIRHAITHAEIAGPLNATAPTPVDQRGDDLGARSRAEAPDGAADPAARAEAALRRGAGGAPAPGRPAGRARRLQATGYQFTEPDLDGALRTALHR